MWSKRDEVPPGAPVNRQPSPEPLKPEPSVPVQQPVREFVKPTAASIGSSMVIKGDIVASEELYVDGDVEGKLELQHRLTIGPRGKVKANIRAREVVIAGNVQGNVEVTEKITIQRNGSLIGDIKTAGIVIDDGAYFKGSIDIVKAPPIVRKAEKSETVRAEATPVSAAPAAKVAHAAR